MTVTVTDKDIEKAVNLYVEEFLARLSKVEDDHVFSERYEKRKAQIIASGAEPMRRTGIFRMNSMLRTVSSGTRSTRPVWLRRSIAAVLTLVLSLSIVMTFSTTARAAVSNWLTETYNKLVKYAFTHNEDDHAYLICAPESLPEGFERVETTREGIYTIKVYKNAETGEYLRFEYSKATEAMKAEVEKQKAGAELLVSSGAIEKYCLDAGATRRVFWYDHQRQLVFFADSNLGRETLAACLENISIRLPLYEPAWLPEGYEEAERSVEYPWVDIIWQNEEGDLLTLDYLDMAEADNINVWSRGDDVESETVDIAGRVGTYYPPSEHDPGCGIIWIEEESHLVFLVIADAMEQEELIDLANSIKCVETDW